VTAPFATRIGIEPCGRFVEPICLTTGPPTVAGEYANVENVCAVPAQIWDGVDPASPGADVGMGEPIRGADVARG
jgi:hypothetical protein